MGGDFQLGYGHVILQIYVPNTSS